MNVDRLKRQVHSIADLRRVAQRRLPQVDRSVLGRQGLAR